MINSRRASALSLVIAFTSALAGCSSDVDDEASGADALTSPNPTGPVTPIAYTPIEKQFVATKDLPKTTLKVATAPMQCPLGCSPSTIHHFVEQVRQFADVDIVVVTEAFFRQTRKWLTAEMAAAGFPVAIASQREKTIPKAQFDVMDFFEGAPYAERDMSSGLMIFAKKQEHDDWMPAWGRAEMAFPDSTTCGEDSFAPKGALRTRFSLGRVAGGIPVGLNVFATHLQANPDPMGILAKPFCKYRTSQQQQIDRLDEWSEWTIHRMKDSPSILSGDFNFESTGAAYADDGKDGSEMPEGQRNWNDFVTKILKPADMLPSFRAAPATFAANGTVPLDLRSSVLVVRPGGESYGAAHRRALEGIRSSARTTQDLEGGLTGMDDRPGEVVKQFFSARSTIRHEGKDTGLVAELVPIRYERTAQQRFCRMPTDGAIEIGREHDPKDGRGPRLVVAIDYDARCTTTGQMVTLRDKPLPSEVDKKEHLVFDHPTRVATYKLVVRSASDDAPVYPSPGAFLHYTGKEVSRSEKKVSLGFELTPPPGEEAAFDKAEIRARVYEPKEGPWLAVTRTGKNTFVASGVVPTSLCADYRVNVQVGYTVEARAGIGQMPTSFDRQIVIQQELAKYSQEWKAACQAPKGSGDTQRVAVGRSAM